MKNIIVLVMITWLLQACNIRTYSEMGMSLQEFKKKNIAESRVYMENNIEAYKMLSEGGMLYYYFRDGKLYKIDQGEVLQRINMDITIQ